MQKIRFRVFGSVSVFLEDSQQWKSLDDFCGKKIGKKQLAFLIYLLLNNKRNISSVELIEQFWDDDSKDPYNSLKNMMFKTRTLLNAVFGDDISLIVTKNGGYGWNPDVQVEVDAVQFEYLYRAAKGKDGKAQLDLMQEAFSLYKGDILLESTCEWLEHLNTYYRTIFIDICKSLSLQLSANESWSDVLYICKTAYAMAPEVEEFTVYYMHAMLATGMEGQAIKHYKEYSTMLWEQYGLVPSVAVEKIYALAVESKDDVEDFAASFVQHLITPPEQLEAFHCSLLVFRNIVQLELRNMIRSKHMSSVVVFKIAIPQEREDLLVDTRRMERILLQNLRAGDPFARLNKGSFIVLLSGADKDGSQKVIERVQSQFYNLYSRSRAIIKASIYSLDAMK